METPHQYAIRRRQVIGSRIRFHREQAGLSKYALGKSIGGEASTIWKWEAAVTAPPVHQLQALAEVLNIPYEALDPDDVTAQPIAA